MVCTTNFTSNIFILRIVERRFYAVYYRIDSFCIFCNLGGDNLCFLSFPHWVNSLRTLCMTLTESDFYLFRITQIWLCLAITVRCSNRFNLPAFLLLLWITHAHTNGKKGRMVLLCCAASLLKKKIIIKLMRRCVWLTVTLFNKLTCLYP